MSNAYWLGRLVVPPFIKVAYGLRVRDRHHLPAEGGALLVSNHISLLDPPAIGSSAAPREINYMAKRELFKNPLFGWLIRTFNAIPVDRGRIDRKLLGRLRDLLISGEVLLIFPEGTRSRTGELGKARPGTGMLAKMANVPIVPAYISGSNTLLKALVRLRPVTVTFGAPLTVEELGAYPDNADGYRALSDEMMARIRRIKESVEQPETLSITSQET